MDALNDYLANLILDTRRMTLKAEGPGEVTASMIETGHDVEIMNPDLVICRLFSASAKLEILPAQPTE